MISVIKGKMNEFKCEVLPPSCGLMWKRWKGFGYSDLHHWGCFDIRGVADARFLLCLLFTYCKEGKPGLDLNYFSFTQLPRPSDRFPAINSLIQKINLRKRRDSLILGVVIGVCTILLLLYTFHWSSFELRSNVSMMGFILPFVVSLIQKQCNIEKEYHLSDWRVYLFSELRGNLYIASCILLEF